MIWVLIQYQDVIQNLLIVSGVAPARLRALRGVQARPRTPRDRIFAILFLIALQPGLLGPVRAGRRHRSTSTPTALSTAAGVPASLFQSINPIYIILLAPIFAGLWIVLGKRGLEPSAPAKFGLALVQVGLGFLVFVWGAQLGRASTVADPGDLRLPDLPAAHHRRAVPLARSACRAMNRLAPTFMASLIMGAWFYMTAVGNFVAGKIGEATGGEERRDDQGSDAGDLQTRSAGSRSASAWSCSLCRPIVKRLDAPRHAARTTTTSPVDIELAEPQAGIAGAGRRHAPGGTSGALTADAGRLTAALGFGCALAAGLAACADAGAQAGPRRYRADDPYPSTYHAYPRRRRPRSSARPSTTARAGGSTTARSLIADGKIVAVGGADLAIPDGATRASTAAASASPPA